MDENMCHQEQINDDNLPLRADEPVSIRMLIKTLIKAHTRVDKKLVEIVTHCMATKDE